MRLIGWAVAFNSSRERTYQRPFLSHREASVSHRADRRPELPFTPGENLSEDGSARPPRWPPQWTTACRRRAQQATCERRGQICCRAAGRISASRRKS